MAVTKRTTATTNSAQTNANQQWEKASAFLNIGLPTKSGETVRVDSIKLKASNVVHKQIIDRLSNPDLTAEERAAAMSRLKDLLIIDFTVVRSDEEKELDLF